MSFTHDQPLVSVGIATYNRPQGLRRQLTSITGQTYKNLEIILSNDCSPVEETEAVIREFAQKDSRIKYFKQPNNLGVVGNLGFVLRQASGEFFMWADDDDYFESFFVDKCVGKLIRHGEHFVAATMETHYFDGQRDYEFFPQCLPHYDAQPIGVYERISRMIERQYGDGLMYSLFRRSALFNGDTSFTSIFDLSFRFGPALYYFVVAKGQIIALPEIGFHKNVNARVYARAKWHITGGRVPGKKLLKKIKRLPKTITYHRRDLANTRAIISRLPIDDKMKQDLYKKTRRETLRAFIHIMTFKKSLLQDK